MVESRENYYAILGIAEDADTADIEEALEIYQENMTLQLNNSLTMQSARFAINSIIPAIRRNLLAGQANRLHYDQQLAEMRLQQERTDEQADDQERDTPIRQPFFFDPYNGYDTETPAYTLREIAERLDQEWEHARTWIADTKSTLHPLVGYLTHAALRRTLAEQVREITQAVSARTGTGMDVNEAIERCILLLNPEVERPTVAVRGIDNDGDSFNAGSFLPDSTGKNQLILYSRGQRGCTFGSIESKTSWLTFEFGQSTMRFALMTEGTDARIGPSSMKIPLHFHLSWLPHPTDQSTEVYIHIENCEPPLTLRIPIQIHVLPLPPCVVFEPKITTPILIGASSDGNPVKVTFIPRNRGDEHLIPLVARISTHDPAAHVQPEHFHANEPITLTIETRNRQRGSSYDVIFNIDYSMTAGAKGPEKIHIRGETLPTTLQSMRRVKRFRARLLAGFPAAIAGSIFLGALGMGLAGHIMSAWLLLLAIPLFLLTLTHMGTSIVITHMRRADRPNLQKKHISPYILWGIPLGAGLLLGLVCGLIADAGTSFLISASVGALIGGSIGFLMDSTISAKPPAQKRIQN